MAWGYWSATPVADRGRSPRRNKESSQETNNLHIQQQRHTQSQNMVETIEDPAPISQETYCTIIPNSSTTEQSLHRVETEFEAEHHQLSR